MNTFRACDAIEFVRAMDSCAGDPTKARLNLGLLNKRLNDLKDKGEEIPSYLLAAYRGYEAVIAPPMLIVKLDDTL